MSLKSGFDGAVVYVGCHPDSSRVGRQRRPKIRLKHIKGSRVRVGSQRSSIASYVRSHCQRFPSYPRLMAAAMGKPLPSQPCHCEICEGRTQGWPVGYHRGRKSWECWLHEQSEWFLRSLPSSASIVRCE